MNDALTILKAAGAVVVTYPRLKGQKPWWAVLNQPIPDRRPGDKGGRR